ncbi:MAG: HyaD/HybD family hydrogenase maturation endopeptidase [Aquificae bacterium]|nr:HyaD/HybD family hydrogenase maturation endopeptidase [Aquificota bacterium]
MITVLGIGNLLLSDEGLGVVAVRKFQEEYEIPEGVQVLDGGTLGIDLMYFLQDTDKLLVVDAVSGGKEPGSLYRIEGEAVKKYFRSKVSMHELGFQEVMALMELTGNSFEEVVVIGLEPKSLELSLELSEEVRSKIPLLVEEIRKQLELWGVKPRRKKGEAL